MPVNGIIVLAVDRDEFWQVVEQARVTVGETVSAKTAEMVAQQLVTRLTALGPTAAVEFQQVYDDLNRETYRWDLWAAAYLMRGGCSDDGFDYFRGWLIAQGRYHQDRLTDEQATSTTVGPN